jgi:hypothetical protein
MSKLFTPTEGWLSSVSVEVEFGIETRVRVGSITCGPDSAYAVSTIVKAAVVIAPITAKAAAVVGASGLQIER